MQNITQQIAQELSIKNGQVQAVLSLSNEGATIPFIARYRKEATGELDEIQIESVISIHKQLQELEQRREFILKTILDQEKLTPELKSKIESASSIQILEDLYLPYKPKRQTKAQKAIQKGLEPLALKIFKQENGIPSDWASDFLNEEVSSIDDAIQGAQDIIAEWISEDARVREKLRQFFQKKAILTTKLVKDKEEEGQKFKDYFEFSELLHKMPSHRYLAIRRGVEEAVIRMSIAPDQDSALDQIDRIIIHKENPASDIVEQAITDAYKRLLQPSLETEFRNEKKKQADEQAITVFSENLRQLLLASPLGQKRILAVDPGFRTGCKIVCISETGSLLANDVIYPHPPQKQVHESELLLQHLVDKHQIEVIAIGNGTASRESESLIRNIQFSSKPMVIVVSEAGASVYSASEIARTEFPDHDVTVRGAVSIGRRVLDPLAELVKIDPKAIGVGQYQHDVDQTALKSALDRVVESCVNKVGVDINTASEQLLSYVAGLGPALARQIIRFRSSIGKFSSRKELKEVPRLGSKAFEQCAGFLRIPNADNPLDSSAVHPERYKLVEQMAKDVSSNTSNLMQDPEIRKKINIQNYQSEEVGLPTLHDILQELEKPGRDPRAEFQAFQFDEHVSKIEDLSEGMLLPGIVTNITDFGAFIDIGLKQDGLVHISKIANKYISHPSEVLSLGQQLEVTVTQIDIARKRIGLSMID